MIERETVERALKCAIFPKFILDADDLQRVCNTLLAYLDAAPIEKVREWAQAEQEGRLQILPCATGMTYAGICEEQHLKSSGWKTVRWIETGVIKGFETIVHMTARKAGFDHCRSNEDLGERWFVGKDALNRAKAVLKRSESK